MKNTIRLNAEYPHPPAKVWAAIATSEALGEWLMPNDFQAVLGHRFTFRTDPAPGFDGIVHCQVLRIDPPHELSYSWRGGPDSKSGRFDLDTVVTYRLEATGTGTRLHFEQRGFNTFKSKMIGMMLGSGWKRMSRTTLPAVLQRLDDDNRLGAPTQESEAMRCHKLGLVRLAAPIVRLLPERSKSNA